MSDDDEVKLVIDSGSYNTKIGEAGNDSPSINFSTTVGGDSKVSRTFIYHVKFA